MHDGTCIAAEVCYHWYLLCSRHKALKALVHDVLLQALLKAAGKPSVLGSMEENDPDADDDNDNDDGDQDGNREADKGVKSSSVVDKITDLLGKTGLTSS